VLPVESASNLLINIESYLLLLF